MRRYWDYSEAERAKLTEEQITPLLSYELMEKGILAVEPPKIEEEVVVPLATRPVFLLREVEPYTTHTVLPIAFRSMEDAQRARDAIAFMREQEGWSGPFFTRAPARLEIVTEEMPTRDAVMAAKVPLDERQRRETANRNERQRFEKEQKAVSDATAAIWADWRRCREEEAYRQKIRDTFAEYIRMTGGDGALAGQFLAKVFDVSDIEAALGGAPVTVTVAVERPGDPSGEPEAGSLPL